VHDNFNFVGALAEYAQKENTVKVVGPKYEDGECELLPNNQRKFEVECIIHFVDENGDRRVSTVASGSTKKSAKRQAAAAMFRQLESEGRNLSLKPILYHKPNEGEAAVLIDTVVVDKKDKDNGTATTDWDVPDETEKQSSTQPEPVYWQQLQDLADDLKLKLEIEDITLIAGNTFKCMISTGSQEQFNDSTPRVACGESSDSFDAAKETAAQKMITLFLRHGQATNNRVSGPDTHV
jgi:hypothetical protein